MTDWHGWKITDVTGERTLRIGPLPGREQLALYIEENGRITALAYFRGDRKAALAMEFIDQLARVGRFAKEPSR